ncbi:OsmC family protein [soil metagenome]
MRVELQRVNDAFHFEAVGSAGVKVHLDSSPDSGGQNLGARPMEMVLMGLGGCSAIDIILILEKQRQKVQDFRITIDGERAQGVIPAVFTTIHLHYTLTGELDEKKVKRAVELSMEKYCSVSAMLNKTATITYSFSVEPGQPTAVEPGQQGEVNG